LPGCGGGRREFHSRLGFVFYLAELGHVAAARQFNAQRGIPAFVFVVRGQALAQQAGLHANNGIVAGIVVRQPMKDGQAERVLLQAVGAAFDGLGDNIPEQAAKLVGLAQPARRKDAFEFGLDLGSV
jgi:hypothetical protein